MENLALGKPVSSSVSSAAPFAVQRVTDGGMGNLEFYLAYPAEPEPVEVTIDLESVQELNRVVVYAYTINNSAERYVVEVSRDGEESRQVGAHLERPKKSAASMEHRFPALMARYVRIKSHGNKGYVFDSFSKLVEVQVFNDQSVSYMATSHGVTAWKKCGCLP